MANNEMAQQRPAGQIAALDDLDQRLVAELQADGRLSMRALAERMHISRAGCYARVERLHRDGVITGYSATVDSRRLGRGLSAFVYVKIRQHSWKQVRQAMQQVSEIEHGYLVTGENDLLLFIRTRDADSLRDLVLNHLQAMEDVQSTHTVLVFDELR